MTSWTKFLQEPPAISSVARAIHQGRRTLWLGSQPISVISVDMAALAAASPSVAADLQQAGLTAQQEDAYRAAILRVGFTRMAAEDWVDSIASNSVLGKNLAFRAAHDAEFKALAGTGMWITQ